MSNENKPIANSIKEQTYYKGKTAEVRKWAFASGELVYNLPWMLISSFWRFYDRHCTDSCSDGSDFVFGLSNLGRSKRPYDWFNGGPNKSKMGRYRPWMLGGAVCLMPIVVLLLRRTRLGV